jgi:hypothetical protein
MAALAPQAVIFGVIPVMMFLGSQFPDAGKNPFCLFAWGVPALKAIKFQ